MTQRNWRFPKIFAFSPSHEDLKALIAQAHRSVYKNDSSPIITDLIDNIMSIPSCLQDAKSKVTLVREWIKQNPRPPSSNTKLEPEVQKIETPIKEPYNGGTGEAAKKAAMQAQQVGAYVWISRSCSGQLKCIYQMDISVLLNFRNHTKGQKKNYNVHNAMLPNGTEVFIFNPQLIILDLLNSSILT